jgi:hypothetical protein
MAVPKEVQSIIDDYVKDSTADCGFLFAKKWLHLDNSIESNKIRTGIPIQEFGINYSFLDTCKDSISFGTIILPKDIWILPICYKDKVIYEVQISKYSGSWKMVGTSELATGNVWEMLIKIYSDSSIIRPVLVVDGLNKFLYFPQKGKRKVYYIRPGWKNDTLATVLPGSLESLNDSKELVKYWKKIGKGSNNTLDNLIQRRKNVEKNGGSK